MEVRVEPEVGEDTPAPTNLQPIQQPLSRLAEGKVDWVILEHDPQAGLLSSNEGLRAAIFVAATSTEGTNSSAVETADASLLLPDETVPSKSESLAVFTTWVNANFGRRSCRVWMFTLQNVCHLVRWSGPGLARATRSKLIQQAKEATKTCTALFQTFTLKEYSCSSYESLLLVYYPLTGTTPPPAPEIKIIEETPSEIDTTSLSPFQERLHQPETPKSAEAPRSPRGFAKRLFVNLVGKESEEDACSYFKLKPDFVCALSRHIKANTQYFAVAWQAGGGSALRIVHLNGKELGRCPEHPRCARGLKQQANAFDLSMLNPRLLVAGAENAVALYSLPDSSDTKLDIMPTSTLTVQGKVTVCMFSPHVDDLLCTSSFHPDTGSVLQLWDAATSECLATLNELHGNKAIDDAAFGRNSSLLATTGKDRFVSILNPLSAEPVLHRFEPKENTRDIQVIWVDNDHLLTIGLATGSLQSISLWQIEPELKCVATHALAVSPQLPMPHFDSDSGVLIMCSSGSPKVQFFRVTPSQEPFIHSLSSYVAPSDFMAQSFLHKTAVAVRDVEILHSLKLSRNKVVPVSWQVPRSRKEFFQDDLYTPTLPLMSTMSAQEWRRGLPGKELVRVSLQPSDMTCLSDAPKIERTPNKHAKDDNASPAWKEALRTRAKSVGVSPPTLPTIKPSEKPSWMVKLKEDGGGGGGSSSPRALSFEMVGITIKDPPSFQASLQSLTDELSNTHWLMVGYTGQAELNVVASGNTYEQGLLALQPHLPVNEIRYLLLRLLDVKENVFRLYFSQITGPKVTPIPKSKSVLHVAELKRFLSASISIAGEFNGLETYEELLYEISKLKTAVLISTEAGAKKSMRKPIQLQDEAKFYESIRQLQSDQDPTDWLIFGYTEGDGNHNITQLGSGQTGLAGVIEHLEAMHEDANNAVRYIVLKVLLDGGNGLNVKTIMITWVGKDVLPTKKAQSSFDRRDLMSWCTHFTSISAEFEASSLDEISSATIARKLLGVGRGNQSNVVEGEALASASAQVLMGKNMYGGMDSTCVIADLPELNKALKQLSDHSSGVKWVVLEYDSQDPNGLTVRLADKGEGGVLQWRERMTETNVLFALQRMTLLEHGAATKTCMVSWVGMKADPMTKARSSGHQINIHDYLSKYITITARLRIDSDIQNFTDGDLISKLNHGGGETSEEATSDFQQFASKPITEQVEYQSFVPTAEQVGIVFTGTPLESITAALHELKSGARSMLKIYIRGKNMRELRIHGVDDNIVESNVISETQVQTSSAPASDLQQKDAGTEPAIPDSKQEVAQSTSEHQPAPEQQPQSADEALGETVESATQPKEKQENFTLETTTNGEETTQVASVVTTQEETEAKVVTELEVLSEEWRKEHLLPTLDRVCVFVLAIRTAEMGYGMSRKFVYIQWIGENVLKFPRSRALEAHAALVNMCSSVLQLSGIMQAVKPEEVTRETVLEKITGSKLRVATTLPDKLLTSSSLGEKNTLVYGDEVKLLSVLDELVDVANPLTWLCLTYKEGGCEVLDLVATGTEEIAMEGFKTLMNSQQSFFIVQQVKWTTDRDMRGLIAAERVDRDKEGIHYGLLHWVGSDVGLMEKALGAYHWDNFSRLVSKHLASKGLVIQGGHLHATELADLTFEEIRGAMRLYD